VQQLLHQVRQVEDSDLPTVGLVLRELERVEEIVQEVRDELDGLPKNQPITIRIQDEIDQCNVGKACRR
jgi:hypothetical protein